MRPRGPNLAKPDFVEQRLKPTVAAHRVVKQPDEGYDREEFPHHACKSGPAGTSLPYTTVNPIYKGAATIAKAREVHGIADPSKPQLDMFGMLGGGR